MQSHIVWKKDEGLFKKWKWFVTIILVAATMLVIRLEDQGVVDTPVRKMVTTSADLTYLSELGQSWFDKENEAITVSSDVGQADLLTFANARFLKRDIYCSMMLAYQFMPDRTV